MLWLFHHLLASHKQHKRNLWHGLQQMAKMLLMHLFLIPSHLQFGMGSSTLQWKSFPMRFLRFLTVHCWWNWPIMAKSGHLYGPGERSLFASEFWQEWSCQSLEKASVHQVQTLAATLTFWFPWCSAWYSLCLPCFYAGMSKSDRVQMCRDR